MTIKGHRESLGKLSKHSKTYDHGKLSKQIKTLMGWYYSSGESQGINQRKKGV